MVTYTKEEKETLIRRFELQRNERRAGLVNELDKICDIFQSKFERRLNRVPKKFAELKIKDILEVERDHKLKIYQLINDIHSLKRSKTTVNVDNDELLKLEIAKMKKRKVENLRSLQKRKESMVSSGRVSKRFSKRN